VAPLVAGLVRPTHVHDLDGQVASRAENLVRHCRAIQQARPAGAAARSDHQLAGAGLACRPDQPGGNVAGPDLRQRPVHLAEQPAVLLQPGLRRSAEVVEISDVYPLEPGIRQPGQLGGVADEPFVGGRSLQADHDDRGLHRLADIAGGKERRDRIGNGVIQPQLGELLQGGEIGETEIARQRRIHPLLGDDEALGQPAAKRRGRQVDELDLAGPHERVGHRLGRVHAGDPGDQRAQRFDVGDVEGGIDVDAVGEQLTDVVPAFRVPLAGEVGVGQLVHQGQLRATVQDGGDVQLGKADAPVGDRTSRQDFEIGELGRGRRPPVPLPVRHDRVDAGAAPGACVPQHLVGLPHPGGNPQVGAQPAPAHHRWMPSDMRAGCHAAAGTGHPASWHVRRRGEPAGHP
jgi:hypothetical protein